MIRNTTLGLVAAAATLVAAMGITASTASAGGGYGYGYYKPYYCHKVIVGYDYYGRPIWRCVKKYYRYGYGGGY
jgi:hypothetical protein